MKVVFGLSPWGAVSQMEGQGRVPLNAEGTMSKGSNTLQHTLLPWELNPTGGQGGIFLAAPPACPPTKM